MYEKELTPNSIETAEYRAGYEAGKIQGTHLATIDHLQHIIRQLHYTPEQAVMLLQIPKSSRNSYIKIMQNRIRQKPDKFL